MASCSWSPLWTPLSDNNLSGWVETFEQAEDVRKAFEVQKALKFVSRRSPSNFGQWQSQENSIVSQLKGTFRVRYSDIGDAVVPYDGVPFIILARHERWCMFGKDQHIAQKEKKLQAQENEKQDDEPPAKKSRKILQTTKKIGCPARIIMKSVVRFPDFKISTSTERVKRAGSEHLRNLLKSEPPPSLKEEHIIYIALPSDEAHQNTHDLGQLTGLMNPLKKEIREKIVELVGKGVCSVREMRTEIQHYVESRVFDGNQQPSPTDAAYFPRNETIRKHMSMARLKLRNLKLYKEKLSSGGKGMTPISAMTLICREKLTAVEKATSLCQNVDVLQQTAMLLDDAVTYIFSHLRNPKKASSSLPMPLSDKDIQAVLQEAVTTVEADAGSEPPESEGELLDVFESFDVNLEEELEQLMFPITSEDLAGDESLLDCLADVIATGAR
ncbi:calcium-responsive transcription factor-like [Asterias rubens]|uniref:calcium-responsive transcription factor-like n=1 Tax=Asterias rubens TaxID=7604 RepID=UPI0014557CF3|nr:calcium-responsive transcription factor-like [Asterias rubens]